MTVGFCRHRSVPWPAWLSLTRSLSALKASRWTVSLVCCQRHSHCRRFLRPAMMSSSIQEMSGLSVNTDLFRGTCLSTSSDSVELYWSTSLARVLARERLRSDAWMSLLKAAWSIDLILRYSLTCLVGAGFSIPSEKWTAWWSDRRSETTVPAMSHWEFESTRSRMWRDGIQSSKYRRCRPTINIVKIMYWGNNTICIDVVSSSF